MKGKPRERATQFPSSSLGGQRSESSVSDEDNEITAQGRSTISITKQQPSLTDLLEEDRRTLPEYSHLLHSPVSATEYSGDTAVANLDRPVGETMGSESASSPQKQENKVVTQAIVVTKVGDWDSSLPIVLEEELRRLVERKKSVDDLNDAHSTDLREKVKPFQGEVVSFTARTRQLVFVGIAQSSSGRPLDRLVAKQMEVWIVGGPLTNRKLISKAVVTANSFTRAEFEEEISKGTTGDRTMKLLEGPQKIIIRLDSHVKLAMSVCDRNSDLTFSPKHYCVVREAFISPDAFHSVSFLLDYESELAIRELCCECVVDQHPDDTARTELFPGVVTPTTSIFYKVPLPDEPSSTEVCIHFLLQLNTIC